MSSLDVDEMFSKIGETLGWFQMGNVDSAIKSLTDKKKNKKGNTKSVTKASQSKSKKQDKCDTKKTKTTTKKKSTVEQNITTTSTVSDVDHSEVSLENANPNANENTLINQSALVSLETTIEEGTCFSINKNKPGHGFDSDDKIKFSDVSCVSDNSVTTGICKKIQFCSDDSTSDYKSDMSLSIISSDSSPHSGLSTEKNRLILLTDGNANEKNTHSLLSTEALTNTSKNNSGDSDDSLAIDDDDDDEEDFDMFLKNMLTPASKNRSISPTSSVEEVFSITDSDSLTEGIVDCSADDSLHSNGGNKKGENSNKDEKLLTNNLKTTELYREKGICNSKPLVNRGSNLDWRNDRTLCLSSSSDSDDDFDIFLEKMKTPVSKKKSLSPSTMDQFIVSDSDSESNDEDYSVSLYHRIRPISPDMTALPSFSEMMKTSGNPVFTKKEVNRDNDKSSSTSKNGDSRSVKPPGSSSGALFKKPLPNVPSSVTAKQIPTAKKSFVSVKNTPPNLPKLPEPPKTCPNLKYNHPLKENNSQISQSGNYSSFLKSLSGTNNYSSFNAEAEKYVKQFKKYQVELVAKLFRIFNETVFDNRFPADFSIQWNKRLRTTAGHCKLKSRYTLKTEVTRTAEICLATKVCDTAERVRDTLVHELCHAAVWVFNGSREGHGRLWQCWAGKANSIHPYLPFIKRCHSYSIAKKYTYKCTRCAYSFGRHSKSLDTTKKVCGYCRGTFELVPTTSNLSASGTPGTPARTPGKFALFVKEHYGTIKKNKEYSHKDIMNILSTKFKNSKITDSL